MNVVYKCYAVDTITGSILQRKVIHEVKVKTPPIMDIVCLRLPVK